MRTRGLLAGLVVPLLLLAACAEETSQSASSGSSSSSSSPAASDAASTSASATPRPEGPACRAVWRNGATLPGGYSGCVAGDKAVRPSDRYCEFGRKLVIFQDRFYAVRTGTIHRTDGPLAQDPGYRSAMASCMA
jgi:hypothetical protein